MVLAVCLYSCADAVNVPSQGRITKVINMKPEELRGMIEETAGTRMFEQKKQAAVKTIEKKEAKVAEINKILAEEITPMLEKLQAERAEMIKFMSNSAECERLTRFCVAYDYKNAESACARAASESAELEAELAESAAAAMKAAADLEAAEAGIERLAETQRGHMEGQYKALLEAKEELSKDVYQRSSVVQNKRKGIAEERKSQAALQQQCKPAADVAAVCLTDA